MARKLILRYRSGDSSGNSGSRTSGQSNKNNLLRGFLGPDSIGVRQSLLALVISSLTATMAGALLAGITGTLEKLPGLLVLVPAAIGMRGNIFGALGSRLSTSIHAGTFRLSRRFDTIVGQNILAASILSLVTAVALGLLTKVLAPMFGLDAVIGMSDLVVVSGVGALLSSAVVMLVALFLASSSARHSWDLDNVNAPLVSAVGDLVTLPALFVGSLLVASGALTVFFALFFGIASLASLVWAMRGAPALVVQIIRESVPVLLGTGVVLIIAGVVIEHRINDFASYRTLLVLVPACLAAAGAIGGILSGRLSSKLHLGVIEPATIPGRSARRDLRFGFFLAIPIFVLNGLLAQSIGYVFSFSSPGMIKVILISLIGGLIATGLAGVIAYYGTVLALRIGVDPDTYGIPLVTSTVDLAGAAGLVLAISWVGVS